MYIPIHRNFNVNREDIISGDLEYVFLSLIITTNITMCLAPFVKGSSSTTPVANPSHPSSSPSLGSTFYYKSFPYSVESYLIEILHRSEQPCLLKLTIILLDFTSQTVSSLLILLQTGTVTVNDQTMRLKVLQLHRLLACGFSVGSRSFKPRRKETWITRPKVLDQVLYCTVVYCNVQ